MNGTCRLNLEHVVRSKSRLKQKVPFNNLVLIPAQQKYGKSATYSAFIAVARNRHKKCVYDRSVRANDGRIGDKYAEWL
jgi:hypothetical protein